MKQLFDGHGTGEGYLSSPQAGTLKDIVGNVALLEEEHSVQPNRRLGVSLEYRLAALEAGIAFEWGSPWVESVSAGPRNSIPAGQVTGPFLSAMRSIGLAWLCVGESNGRGAVERLQEAATAADLSIAAEPSTAVVDVVENEGSAAGPSRWTLESLLRLVDSMITLQRSSSLQAGGPRTEQSMLIALSEVEAPLFDDVLERIKALQVPVTPLLVASSRRSSLTAVVNAPMLEHVALVLPYHQRLASLRAPGALRMGGKEASKHLGIGMTGREEAKCVSQGLDKLSAVCGSLLDSDYPLIGGSGSPGPGACPGYMLREEYDMWGSLSSNREAIDAAFGIRTAVGTTTVTREAKR